MATTESAPARASSLRLTDELTENIRSLSFDGLKALPRRGAEIGGLITADSCSPSVGDDLLSVPCEYLFGPSYHLSANDLPKIQAAVDQCSKAGRRVVAFFRSCTRSDETVDSDDQLAIREAGADIPFVVIAIPALNGSCRIHIFRRLPAGEWTAVDEVALPSPFKTLPPQEALRVLESAASEAAPVPLAVENRAIEPPRDIQFSRAQFNEAKPNKSPLSKLWIGLLYTGLVFLGTTAVLQFWPKPRSSPPLQASSTPLQVSKSASADSGLGLAVKPEGGQLHLTWSRESSAASSATSGSLQIYDGGRPTSLALGPNDLKEGSILYTPHTGDVTFQVRLAGPSGTTREELIRVVGPAPATAVRAVSTKPFQLPSGATARPKPELQAVVVPPPAVAPPAVPPPATAPALRSVLPPETAASPAASASAPATSPAPVESKAAPVTPQTFPIDRLPPPRVVPSPLLVAPTPLRRVQPALSPNRWNVAETTRIGIMVSVDRKGHVTDVRPEIAGKSKSAYLQALCLTAARQWTFKPATVNGRPVESTYRIEFVFAPR